MAGTAQSRRVTAAPHSDARQILIEHNKLIDDLETLRAAFVALTAKLDADGGVTDADYASTLDVAAVDLTAAKIEDDSGDEITS